MSPMDLEIMLMNLNILTISKRKILVKLWLSPIEKVHHFQTKRVIDVKHVFEYKNESTSLNEKRRAYF